MSSKDRTPLRIGIALIVIVLSTLAIYGFSPQSQPQSYPFKTWKLNDAVQDKKLSYKADSVRQDDVGLPGFWTPGQNATFLLVNMAFTNHSGELYQMSPITNMKIRDNENHEYPVSSAPSITKGLGGPVKNGETMSGEVGFIVPKNAHGLVLVFDPKIVNENIIQVDLHR